MVVSIKQRLLETGYFNDNEWIDLYVELIQKNYGTKKTEHLTQSHHIVPRYCFYSRDEKVDDSKDNKVNMSVSDHIKAHYYLALASSTEYSRYSNESSIHFICRSREDISVIIEDLPYYESLCVDYAILNSKLQIGKQCGEKNGFYGKHHTEDAKKLMRKNHPHLRGKDHPNYGKHLSNEIKEKLRDANTGRIKTEEEKRKRLDTINKNGGMSHYLTDERNRKVSNSMKNVWSDDGYREKMSKAVKSLWEDEEYRRKHIEGMTGKKRVISHKKCPFCGRDISSSNYSKHIKTHETGYRYNKAK